ncbi:hypothetical protein [Prosthecobacter vanneervenii]|uniref:Condensation domain-containing protein n=1 Tax=Prosthecobacter vanneervenii TaxID=48466 RepID=A0A7W8DKQ9_9BACT|nr:hypothetical protein [Prosthecobacter vanneervenii]MBB5033290.1 hypothetical protein [Prosthecobacter vanneervenii]
MSSSDSSICQFPLTGTDGFVAALDYLARSADGRGLDALSEIQVCGQSNAERLRWLAAELPQRMPLLHATLRKDSVFGVPYWEFSGEAAPIPIEFHRVAGVEGEENSVVESMSALRRLRMQGRKRTSLGPPHIRLDVVRTSDQTWTMLMNWSHLLLDGTGVELLFKHMDELWHDPQAASPQQPMVRHDKPWWKLFQESESCGTHLMNLGAEPFVSSSRGRVASGRRCCLWETFSKEETARIRLTLGKIGGDMMRTFFYAGLAARCHQAVFQSRGQLGIPYAVPMPVQQRPKDGNGLTAIFQNHMSMFFYILKDADLTNLAIASKALMKQHMEHLKLKRHLSFNSMQLLTRHMPGKTMLDLVRLAQRGEIASCYHAYTGSFGEGMTSFCGGEILNAIHMPTVNAPPGSGLFVSECRDQLTVTVSYLDTCLSEAETELMRERWRSDLLGE